MIRPPLTTTKFLVVASFCFVMAGNKQVVLCSVSISVYANNPYSQNRICRKLVFELMWEAKQMPHVVNGALYLRPNKLKSCCLLLYFME